MTEILSLTFMQNALLAGLLASVVCGTIGSLVVVNRQVFLAGGVAHSAYGGVGLAFFLGLPVLPTTIAFTLAVALIMGTVALRRGERTDTIIGVMWASGMALGVLLMDITPGYNVDLMSYLFGSILAVSRADLLVMAGLDAVVVVVVLLAYRHLLAFSFDRDFAQSRGLPVAGLHFLVLVLTALSVVMIIRIVGLILVIALLTIPSAMAEQRAHSLAGMMVRSCLWSAIFCTVGLVVSYGLNLTSGASIIAVASLSFFANFLRKTITRALPSTIEPHQEAET
ncbi:MAG: metal ABC transporter permease [Deltaproteobacteria bacterium]|nr:metal ABC transporter permease [Deltaproteobacteria bacterium]